VNFFGHASAAAWYDDRPAYVLGAMVPDLQGMLGLEPPGWLDPAVEAGVRLHHATDAAFHGLPLVVELMAAARRELTVAGVSRGPARAVAHVGTELVLDEALAADSRAVSIYVAALRLGAAPHAPLRWRAPDDTERFRKLAGALAERSVSTVGAPAAALAARLQRVLAPRPRLALSDAETGLVSEWVVAARPRVVGCASRIASELRSRLAAAGFGSNGCEPVDSRPG